MFIPALYPVHPKSKATADVWKRLLFPVSLGGGGHPESSSPKGDRQDTGWSAAASALTSVPLTLQYCHVVLKKIPPN